MEMNLKTGAMSWRVTAEWDAGSYRVTVSASNIHSSDVQSFTITVLPALYTLEISSSGGGTVTRPGEGYFEYTYGQFVAIEATASPGYRFVYWSGTAVDAGAVSGRTEPSSTVVINGNHTLQANFVPTRPFVLASSVRI